MHIIKLALKLRTCNTNACMCLYQALSSNVVLYTLADYTVHTVNPLLRPPGGLFISNTFGRGGGWEGGGGLLEIGALFTVFM